MLYESVDVSPCAEVSTGNFLYEGNVFFVERGKCRDLLRLDRGTLTLANLDAVPYANADIEVIPGVDGRVEVECDTRPAQEVCGLDGKVVVEEQPHPIFAEDPRPVLPVPFVETEVDYAGARRATKDPSASAEPAHRDVMVVTGYGPGNGIAQRYDDGDLGAEGRSRELCGVMVAVGRERAGGPAPEVVRSGLADVTLISRSREVGQILLERRGIAPTVGTVEVAEFLDVTKKNVGMTGELRVEPRRPTLLRAGDEKVWVSHRELPHRAQISQETGIGGCH